MQSSYLTIDEASAYTGIKKSTLYAKVERREVPHYRIGRSIKLKRDDLDAWMEAHRVECVDATGEARKILRNTRRAKMDIDSLVKKTVAEFKETEYTLPYENQTEIRGLRKEVNHGAL